MRIEPLICWSCYSWFLPKSKHATKFCSGACKQQHYLINKSNKSCSFWSYPPSKELKIKGSINGSENELKELREHFFRYCSSDDKQEKYTLDSKVCLSCAFDKKFSAYAWYVRNGVRDKYGQTWEHWLKNKK